MERELFCSNCHFTTNRESHYIYHLLRRHRHDKNFKVNCCAPGCFYASTSWSGFKSHYSRKHRKSFDFGFDSIEQTVDDFDCIEGTAVPVSQNNTDMYCASLALKLLAKHKLPSSTVDDILESISNLLDFEKEITTANENSGTA